MKGLICAGQGLAPVTRDTCWIFLTLSRDFMAVQLETFQQAGNIQIAP
jgi:hypothetical protein